MAWLLILCGFRGPFTLCHEPLIVPIFMSQHSTSPPSKKRLDSFKVTKNKIYPGKKKNICKRSSANLRKGWKSTRNFVLSGLSCFHKWTTVTTQGKHCNVRLHKGHNLSWSLVLVTFLTEIPDLNNEYNTLRVLHPGNRKVEVMIASLGAKSPKKNTIPPKTKTMSEIHDFFISLPRHHRC